MNQRGAPEESNDPYGGPGSTDYAYGDFRDLDHTNPQVRRDIIRYLLMLKSAGYRGWRYDMVHGYHARGSPSTTSAPTRRSPSASTTGPNSPNRGVGSGRPRRRPNDLSTASSVFDFTTQFTLKDNKSNYAVWAGSATASG